ncbi:MAG: DNA-3-methyladenine glycosylase I [Oceanococcus sp.]
MTAHPTENICGWARNTDIEHAYHDEEWGVPVSDDRKLFEFVILEGAQAGLSWLTILRRREGYRRVFHDFDPHRVAKMDEAEQAQALTDVGIIRNRAKVRSAVNNAQQFLKIQDEFGSFARYNWNFVDAQPVQNKRRDMSEVPATTELSDLIAKDLKKRGFSFMGSTIVYAYMQATGMVNDHAVHCPRHAQVARLGAEFKLAA